MHQLTHKQTAYTLTGAFWFSETLSCLWFRARLCAVCARARDDSMVALLAHTGFIPNSHIEHGCAQACLTTTTTIYVAVCLCVRECERAECRASSSLAEPGKDCSVV